MDVIPVSLFQSQFPAGAARPQSGGDPQVWGAAEVTGQHQCVSRDLETTYTLALHTQLTVCE